MNNESVDISSQLKIAQINKGINNKALAKRLNVSPQRVTDWRRGEGITTSNLVKLSKIFGFASLADFFKLR